MTPFYQTVGVLGGFGPEATVDFYQRVLDYAKKRVTGSRANTGYPKMIIYSCNFIPFDTSDENEKRANPELLEAAKTLEKAGANFIRPNKAITAYLRFSLYRAIKPSIGNLLKKQ